MNELAAMASKHLKKGRNVMAKKRLFIIQLITGIVLLTASLPPAVADDFYQGKTVRIIVGYTPGGFYDIWGRLLARHLGKHIPGHPTFIVLNMPGASSRVAATYVYNIAKPDGLTLGVISNNSFLDQVVGRHEVKFDLARFNWIGTQTKSPILLYIRADTPYRSIHDIMKAKTPPFCGGGATTDQTYLMGKLLEETIGAKLKMVMGYRGGAAVDLAMQRGEVMCRATSLSVHFGREPFLTWDKKGFDRHIIQTGKKRDSRLADVPTIYELMDEAKTSGTSRAIAEIILGGTDFARPFMTSPGVPRDRVRLLREAFAATIKDPEFLDEAEKLRLELNPYLGEELQAQIEKLLDQPPDLVQRLKLRLK
jgi:tripartite-type tricarboxylate transporter receptor subunit TctC